MTLLTLCQPLPATVVLSDTSAGAGRTNLVTPSPREAFAADAAGQTQIVLDLGAACAVDTVFLGFTNLPAGTAVTVLDSFNSQIAAGAVAASYRRAPLRHCAAVLPAPVSTRYVKFLLNTATPLVAGIAAAGLSLTSLGYEQDWNRPISDASKVDRLLDGGFGTSAGVAAGGLAWTWPAMTDAERDRLYALQLDAGVSAEVLAIEPGSDGPGGNECIHWSKLTRLEPFARQLPGESKWAVQVQDWS